jgi:hypothetical protein
VSLAPSCIPDSFHDWAEHVADLASPDNIKLNRGLQVGLNTVPLQIQRHSGPRHYRETSGLVASLRLLCPSFWVVRVSRMELLTQLFFQLTFSVWIFAKPACQLSFLPFLISLYLSTLLCPPSSISYRSFRHKLYLFACATSHTRCSVVSCACIFYSVSILLCYILQLISYFLCPVYVLRSVHVVGEHLVSISGYLL